jgi:hypothetical protein
MLSKEVLSKYESIRLFERYKSLSDTFQTENTFENYDNDLVLKMFSKIDPNFSYYKKEGFFGLNVLEGDFDFRINLSLKYGVVEPIIWGKNIKTKEQFGGPLSRVTKLIQASKDNENIVKIPYPRFTSYEDLEQIAKELVAIFRDFKLVVKGK